MMERNTVATPKRAILAVIGAALFMLAIITCSRESTGISSGNPKVPAPNEVSSPQHASQMAINFGDKFYDVAMPDKDHIWAVGYFGSIVQSSDGGRQWSRQNAGTIRTLTGVSFVNADEGFVVGDQGTIFRTQNGGNTWVKQNNPVSDQKLLKVQFLDANEGFAVGAFGTILHTQDGGNIWERLPFDEDIILNDLVFLSPREGWIAGEFETILHTTDGGKTFEKQRGDELGQIFGIAFKNSMHGIAVGTSGKILITADGGGNWQTAKNPGKDTLLKVHYFGSSLLAIGLRGSMVVSPDDGQTWSVIEIPGHYSWLSGMAFADGVGVLVGNEGKILASNYSVKTWNRLGFGPFKNSDTWPREE